MRHLILALLLVPGLAFAADAAATPAKKDEAPAACAKCADHMAKCADCTAAKVDGKLGCAKCLVAAKDCPECKKAGEKAAEVKPADKK